jgi:hypothetical protein
MSDSSRAELRILKKKLTASFLAATPSTSFFVSRGTRESVNKNRNDLNLRVEIQNTSALSPGSCYKSQLTLGFLPYHSSFRTLVWYMRVHHHIQRLSYPLRWDFRVRFSRRRRPNDSLLRRSDVARRAVLHEIRAHVRDLALARQGFEMARGGEAM